MRVRLSALMAFAALMAAAGPVAAECPFVPPIPTIGEREVRTARELLVGRVVANGPLNGEPTASNFLLRIDEVIRGDAEVGSVRHFFWVGPNWPWMKSGEAFEPIPSCSTLRGAEGELLVMAVEALAPAAWEQTGDVRWWRPATRYYAQGIVTASGTIVSVDDPPVAGLTVDELRALAALPVTDATPRTAPAAPTLMTALAAAGLGVTLFLRRVRRPATT
jgi:hypothetical protein